MEYLLPSPVSQTPQTLQNNFFRKKANAAKTSSQLNVWWFGGVEETPEDGDSCDLVPVRIERTSPNSRRIGGELTIDAPIEDVWAILTDYDNLSIHVPNLVESRRVGTVGMNGISGLGRRRSNNPLPNPRQSKQGDGSYSCRLYQKGAQKIIGFEFGASVTMDMQEKVIVQKSSARPEERKVLFKCVDSEFFSEFDGEWKVVSTETVDESGENTASTTITYVVDVRPKGPVPVAALEWRIREDVPTNLKAVKKASLDVGYAGVMALRGENPSNRLLNPGRVPTGSNNGTMRSDNTGATSRSTGGEINKSTTVNQATPQPQRSQPPVSLLENSRRRVTNLLKEAAPARQRERVTNLLREAAPARQRERVTNLIREAAPARQRERVRNLSQSVRGNLQQRKAKMQPIPSRVPVEWDDNETMAKYLDDSMNRSSRV